MTTDSADKAMKILSVRGSMHAARLFLKAADDMDERALHTALMSPER